MVFEIFYSLACNWSDFSAAMLLLVGSDDSFKPCVRKMDCLMLSEVLQCCSAAVNCIPSSQSAAIQCLLHAACSHDIMEASPLSFNDYL